MKTAVRFDCIEFDVSTERNGNSASLCLKTYNTTVFTGGLYTMVDFMDLKVRVVLNPCKKGDQWEDETWAREQAWAALLAHIQPADLGTMLTAARRAGEASGAEKARAEIRVALGIDSESWDGE